jgi:hypothetical protein
VLAAARGATAVPALALAVASALLPVASSMLARAADVLTITIQQLRVLHAVLDTVKACSLTSWQLILLEEYMPGVISTSFKQLLQASACLAQIASNCPLDCTQQWPNLGKGEQLVTSWTPATRTILLEAVTAKRSSWSCCAGPRTHGSPAGSFVTVCTEQCMQHCMSRCVVLEAASSRVWWTKLMFNAFSAAHEISGVSRAANVRSGAGPGRSHSGALPRQPSVTVGRKWSHRQQHTTGHCCNHD